MAVRKYELVVILDPARGEEEQKQTLNQIDELITKYGGTPDRHEIRGKRRLAYQIRRRREGYYAIVYFDTDSNNEVLAELDRWCKFQEEVLRHLVTHAIEGKATGNPALAEQALARGGGVGPGFRPAYQARERRQADDRAREETQQEATPAATATEQPTVPAAEQPAATVAEQPTAPAPVADPEAKSETPSDSSEEKSS